MSELASSSDDVAVGVTTLTAPSGIASMSKQLI
jgi:hypothetical protein